MASENLYVNPSEAILEMHHGAKPKLCAFWRSQMYLRARELGEAVVGIKPGTIIGDTVVIFPCGLEMTLAMRSESYRADWHNVNNSGETSASKWIFGDYWQAFYRMFHDTGFKNRRFL